MRVEKKNKIKGIVFIGVGFLVLCAGLTWLVASCVKLTAGSSDTEAKCPTIGESFEFERKITIYNTKTNDIILEIEGYMDVRKKSSNELFVTVKVSENVYRVNYVSLNEYTMYMIEDRTGTHSDPYYYTIRWHIGSSPNNKVLPLENEQTSM